MKQSNIFQKVMNHANKIIFLFHSSIVKMYHTRNTCCWNLVEKLQMLPVHHLIAALEYNNVWINDRMKPLQLALIVADGA
jgi:hypothetical protein